MALPALRPVLRIATLVGALLAVLPPAAMAAESYTVGDFTCGGRSGQFDESGTTYIACGATIKRVDASGASLPDIPLASSSSDVAPSPTGNFLYIYASDMSVHRLNRQSDGVTYKLDPAWKPEQFNYWGVMYDPVGKYLQTDAWGNLYISNGSWAPGNPNMILVYSPDGSIRTQFGDWADTGAPGTFNTNMGLAVTRNGQSIYTVEQTAGRVQRFDYNAATGGYDPAAQWGSTNINCDTTGQFSAPYDIGLDPWGYAYVMDTTCGRVQKFTGAGVFVCAFLVNRGDATNKPHGLAVDGHGNVYVPQTDIFARRTTAEPGPWPAITPPWGTPPDTVKPVIVTFTGPASSATNTVTLKQTATDNVGVTRMRLRKDTGAWSAWRDWATTTTYSIGAVKGNHTVDLQVIDAAGNGSIKKTVTIKRT